MRAAGRVAWHREGGSSMVSPNRSSATFGTLLRELRQSQNRTLEQMAALVSRAAGTPVSRVQIQAWEADTQPPGPADLGYLAVALEVPQLLLDAALAKQQAAAKRTSQSVNGANDSKQSRKRFGYHRVS